jgi:hypothetical protein
MTGVPLNPTFLALSLAIVGASGLSLWWLLRGESRTTLLVLALLTCVAVALRLFYATDFPTGLNEDEPKVLYAAGRAVARNTLLAESNISVPILPHALFQGQLIPLVGPWSWAIRSYNLVGGILCTPAAFGAARALGLTVASSLAVAGLVTVLPWSLFYSRVMTGCELNFFQLLYLAALGRLLGARAARPLLKRGTPPITDSSLHPSRPAHPAREPRAVPGWPEFAMGTFALAWLLYGYWPTRAMVPMVFVAAVLASGRARLWCLAILPAALALYAPYVAANLDSNFIGQGANAGVLAGFADPLNVLTRFNQTLGVFLWPRAEDGWLTIRSAAMHPFWLLPIAFVGVLSPSRRALFVAAGFLISLAPTVLAWGPPSTHRLIMAYPFVALAAGSALERFASPRPRRIAAAVLVVATGLWSVRFYFSDDFWPPESRWVFDAQRTALIEALPPPDGLPVVFMRQVSYFRDPRRLITPRDVEWTVDNWLPGKGGAVYAFNWEASPLRAFYEQLLGPQRVQSFGGAFTVAFEPGDWSWLRRHGWSYTARCANNLPREGQVPVLFHPLLTFPDQNCPYPTTHTWRARWDGPRTLLRLRGSGRMAVETGDHRFEGEGGEERSIEFAAEPGMEIRITVTSPPFQPWVYASLFEQTPAGDRLPAWERLVPSFN